MNLSEHAHQEELNLLSSIEVNQATDRVQSELVVTESRLRRPLPSRNGAH